MKLSHILEIIESSTKTWYTASYDPKTELYTTHGSYDTYDDCPKDYQWIINTGRGKKEYIVGVDPTWPDLSWYIPPNKVKFSSNESQEYKYSSGRIQVKDNSVEVYNNDGSYLIINSDKSVREILNGAYANLSFRARTA